ncbi:MAG: hypothetical protein JXQ76_09465 [Campylobacterales bacterium]|nr:hypothetical protein [Campylobacterales bacterium]
MIELTAQEIKNLSSTYIAEDLKKERWFIESIQYNDNSMVAYISVQSQYQSQMDNNQFHLSIFIMLEFTSQLGTIYSNLLAGYKTKNKEIWLLEQTMKSIRPIYSKNNIKVTLLTKFKRQYKNNIFFYYDIKIESPCNGLTLVSFKVKL